MSSKLNHAQRSHKTFNKNYSVFTSFNRRAVRVQDTKRAMKSAKKFKPVEKIKEVLKKTFARKHQDK